MENEDHKSCPKKRRHLLCLIESNKKKGKNEESKDLNKEKIINIINTIFINNSIYSPIYKDNFINRYQIFDILKKCRIISNGIITKICVDMILIKMNRKKRKYNLFDFRNFLTELCHNIYKRKFESSPKEVFESFMNSIYHITSCGYI